MAGSTIRMTCLALALGWTMSPAASVAAPSSAGSAATVAPEPLGGVVTDQTITAAGQDFYQCFSTLWHDQPLAERFSVAVRERPSARMGNRIEVDYANRRVFEAVLPAARGNIRAIGASAVEIAYRNVAAAEVQRLLYRDQDLAGDEF